MPTTFQVLYLGNLADIDSQEGNRVAENAEDLVGLEFGDANQPLIDSAATWSQLGGPDRGFDMNNCRDTDQFSINGGAAQTFDGLSAYHATLTYGDGSTAQITAVIAQDVNGETYLVPEYSDNADHAAFEAGVIESVSLDRLAANVVDQLVADRQDMELVACFTEGTRIRAEHGEIPIEALAAGDRVATLDHGLQRIRWIGSSEVAAAGSLAPIRFAPGVLGNRRALMVSPQHRIYVRNAALDLISDSSDALVPACHMVNGTTICARPGGRVRYYHLMFDHHELIWGEGVLSESFYPGNTGLRALTPEARAEIEALFPQRLPARRYGPTARVTLSAAEWRVARLYTPSAAQLRGPTGPDHLR